LKNVVRNESPSYFANGEQKADWPLGKSLVPDSSICTPGTNFRQLGLGVSCVCMNILLAKKNHKACQQTYIMAISSLADSHNSSYIFAKLRLYCKSCSSFIIWFDKINFRYIYL